MSADLDSISVEDLARFRRGLGDCELVALVDISTGAVLAWDAGLRLPQDHLDAIGDAAIDLFSTAAAGVDHAVLARRTGCRVFVRTPRNRDEVLCVVLGSGAHAARAAEDGHSFLDASGGRDRPSAV